MPLYSFGSNGSGQLGIGHVDDVSVPARCLFDEQGSSLNSSSDINNRAEKNGRILRIVAGGNHTLVLFADGAVYAAGCNEDGRCGQSQTPSTDPLLVGFRRVTVVDDASPGMPYDTFKDVSATWEATFLVPTTSRVDDGREDVVFVLGSGAKGELGLGSGCVRAPAATRIPDFPPQGVGITAIASGMGHTVTVLSNGEVYGWGGARKGQLGEGAVASKIAWSPVRIDGVRFAVGDVACGREFTVVTGDRATGQFAVLGSQGDKWNILSGVPGPGALEGFRGIYASWHGVYVHQKDSSVVCWGRNDRGQLPPGDLPASRHIAVGSEHALALLDDQSVVAFGWGEHGNCGPDTDAQGNVKGAYKRVPLPAEENSAVVGIGAGCATSWVITS